MNKKGNVKNTLGKTRKALNKMKYEIASELSTSSRKKTTRKTSTNKTRKKSSK